MPTFSVTDVIDAVDLANVSSCSIALAADQVQLSLVH